jgi:hypothetical protein
MKRVDRSAGICLPILAAKGLRAGISSLRELLKTLFQTELSVANPVSVRAAHGINLVF